MIPVPAAAGKNTSIATEDKREMLLTLNLNPMRFSLSVQLEECVPVQQNRH